MMNKLQFGLEATREAPAPRSDKTKPKKTEPGFAAALDRARSKDEPRPENAARDTSEKKTATTQDEDAPPTGVQEAAVPEKDPAVVEDEPEAVPDPFEPPTPPPAVLAQLVIPSEPPRPPETRAYVFETARPTSKELEVTVSLPSSVEVDVDLSQLEPTSRPPASSLPPDRGLNDLTAAELASGFEMPWPVPAKTASGPPTVAIPSTQSSPGVVSEAAPPTIVSGTPETDTLIPETETSARRTAPAPHRASLHDAAIRDALHRSTQPSMEAVAETPEAETVETESSDAATEAVEGAELSDPATRRAATPKAMAQAEQAQLRDRLSPTRVQASHASAQLGDEQVQQRQEAATSAVNHMTLRNFAQAQIDHPELGRIRVAARNVGGEIDVEVKARDASAVAVLQSTSGQLSSELRQASVELRDLDVRQDDDAAPKHFGERRGEEADEHAPDRDRRSSTSTTESQDETDEVEVTTGTPVRIVL